MGPRFALAYLGSFLPFAIVTVRLQSLLTGNGFAEDQRGVVLGSVEMLAALAPPLWGYVSDRLHRPRLVLLIAALGSIPLFLLFGLAHTLPVALLVAVAFGLFFRPQIPLLDGLTFHYINHRGGNYGVVRVGGSVGFIAILLLLTVAAPGSGGAIGVILPAFALAAGVQVAALFALPSDRQMESPRERREHPRPELRRFLGRAFLLVTLAAFLGRMAMVSYYHFFTNFVEETLGYDRPGLIWALGPVWEIPVIFFSAWIMRRIGVRTLFAIGLAGVAIRLVGFALATEVWHAAALQPLHALTFGAYHVASVTYVSRLFPAHMKSTAMTVFAALTVGAGGLVGGAVCGSIAHAYGYATMYAAAAGIGAAGLLVLVLLVPPTAKAGEPGVGAV